MPNTDDHALRHGGCLVCQGGAAVDERNGQARETFARRRRHFIAAALAAPLAGAPLLAAAGVRNNGRSGDAPGHPPSGSFVVQAGQALLYRNGEQEVVRDCSILIRNGRVEAVRQSPIRGFPNIDARRQLVVPGLISGHTHACAGIPTRGLIEAGRSFARPLELVETLSDDELDALTALNVAELLLGGATTHVEMSLSLRQFKSYVRVARRWGVRGYPGGMVPGIARLFPIWFRADDQALLDSVPGTLAEIKANLDFARTVNGVDDGRILPQMTPHATDTQTPGTMRALAAAAAELGNGIGIHLSQSSQETATVKRLWGATPAAWCKQFGFHDGPLFAAHLIGFDFAADAEAFNAGGAVYVHCPSANGAGGSSQPYPEALAAGMNVSIGIDTHCNDYLENLKLAVLYGRVRHALLSPTSPVPLRRPDMADAIRGATLVAADGLGRDDLGRIAPGARADLVGIDITGPLVGVGTLPPEPLNNLLYANGQSVRMVMTDGNIQVLDGHFVADDFGRVAGAGAEVVRGIWGRLAGEGWFD
ncbi:MAG: amidohydrolase family protein [Gammaproteobacteria bacterium]|nr:amidohydrolase family protein [Gammaproteobacteria bacterium]NNM01581.1 amidohydrolase family protein [Gammaproteobacteria bacterium]